MRLKKIYNILFTLYFILLFGLLILNSEFLFNEDHTFWINIVIINLICSIIFFGIAWIIINGYQRRVAKQEKLINELKGKLYDAIKDDEQRDKLMKAFEKSIK
jgi:uncharacterized membrane protein YbhN (UPF0104 family)